MKTARFLAGLPDICAHLELAERETNHPTPVSEPGRFCVGSGERALLVYGGEVRLVRSSWLALRKRMPYSFSRESVRKLKGHVAGVTPRRAKRTRKLTPESASAMPKPV